MEKQANYFVVGIFVSVALLALVGFTIWLMGAGDLARKVRYTIYFTEPVSGLTDEGLVKYNGVDVGRIFEMRIAPERNDLIKVDIEVNEETPIRASTTASIELQGITGQSYLELTTAAADQIPPPLVEGEPYPVLEGKGSELRAFIDDLPKLAAQVEKTLGAISLFSKEGAKTAGSIQELSKNTDKKLADTLSAIGDFSKESSKTASSIRGLTDKLKDDPSQILRPPPSNGGVVIPR